MPINTTLNKQRSQSTMSLYRKHEGHKSKDRLLLNKYRLCLKYVPKDVTADKIKQLCSKYGTVLDVTFSSKTPYKFVSFSSKSEMEKALIELKDNQYGFIADVAKHRDNDDTASVTESLLDCIIDDDDNDDEKGNIASGRNEKHRSNSLSRGKNRSGHFSQFSKYRNNKTDIKEQGISSKKNDNQDNKKNIKENSEQSTKKNETSAQSSVVSNQQNLKPIIQAEGNFESDNNKKSDHSDGIHTQYMIRDNIDILSNCVLCMNLGNKACSRCGDCYCSLECQRNDWKRHRYFCIAMPHLVPLSHINTSSHVVDQNSVNMKDQKQLQRIITVGNNVNQTLPGMCNGPVQQSAPKIANQILPGMCNGPVQQGASIIANQSFNMQPYTMITPQGGSYRPQQGPPTSYNYFRPAQNPPPGPFNAHNNIMQHGTQLHKPLYNYNNTTHDPKISHSINTHIASNNKNEQKVSTMTTVSRNDLQKNKDQKTSTVNLSNKESSDNSSKITSIKPLNETVSIQKEEPSSSKEDPKLKTTTNNDVTKEKEQNDSVKSMMKLQSESTEQNKNKNKNDSVNNKTIDLKDCNRAIPIANFPASGNLIQITAVLHPNLVYIRSLDRESDVEYIKCINNINNESKNSKNLTVLPQKGDLVAAKFESIGYCRALVLNPLNQNKIIVAFTDYGLIEEKALKDMKELSNDLKNFKRYVFPVKLKYLKNHDDKINEHKDEIMEYLDSYVECFGKDIKVVYDSNDIEDNDSYEVELIDISCAENLNKHILSMIEK